MEKKTFEVVRKTISSLEDSLAAFDYSKKKPEGFRKKIERFRELHEVLSGWAHDYLTRPQDEDFESRLGRLREFAEICQVSACADSFSQGKGQLPCAGRASLATAPEIAGGL